MEILKEIYKTLLDFIVDLRSTRNQLIWIATGLFIFSVFKGVDPITLGIIAGLNTILYGFYFKSKSDQHKKPDVIQTIHKGIDPDEV